jgi:DNA repair protein RadC
MFFLSLIFGRQIDIFFKSFDMEKANQTTDWTKISEIGLVYKSKIKAAERPCVKTSKEAYDLFFGLWDLDRIELLEEFKVLFLNHGNRVLGIFLVSSGGIAGTVADPRLIFIAALKASASSIILAHSHPSGNLRPSRNDEELTAKIREAGLFLEIKVLDHLILTRSGYFSFADEGLL